ncbi:MAG: hypothetical protein EPN34_12745 [Burkholderiaceae bacterium]|jgi:hypothetical protein|nr:MAG: hypothetical protein EPN34_12745 [Burkholderiaceae bacterium]
MKTLQAPPQTAVVVAELLERLDASREPVDAHQYQVVAERLEALMGTPGINWQPLLERSAAAATVYENLHYGDAGLCRSPLDFAADAELAAREAIDAARRMPPAGSEKPEAAEA